MINESELKEISREQCLDLLNSIKSQGLFEPIVVDPSGHINICCRRIIPKKTSMKNVHLQNLIQQIEQKSKQERSRKYVTKKVKNKCTLLKKLIGKYR